MSSTAVAGIGELVTCDGTGADLLGIHSSAALVVEDGMIAWIGSTAAVPAADNSIDVGGRVIIPGFVDSAQPSGLRRRPKHRVRGSHDRPAVRRRGHRRHGCGDPRRHRR